MAKFRAIVMKANDNVATVVEPIAPNTGVDLKVGEETVSIQVSEAIPFGHKFAIREIGEGDRIVKYGEVIGLATQNIKVGQHVHVHNLESCRGRGDK
ncbi:D-galactarate dehydratase [Anaerosporomusa subterranea]|uniref:D-galactarate dehydratase n=2 Tax=Anaerosporomusa subterranea TaxID=1794912 RepID=A0A154BLI9_ANASB|nr:D-galactarate dehydratase [Anaerosporomusa subterranea]